MGVRGHVAVLRAVGLPLLVILLFALLAGVGASRSQWWNGDPDSAATESAAEDSAAGHSVGDEQEDDGQKDDAQEAEAEPPTFDHAWAERDVEGRWMLLRRLDPASAEAAELRQRAFREEDWELLEMLAIYPWRVGSNEASGLLAEELPEGDLAPPLLRVATWSLGNPDSHLKDWSYNVLVKDHPGLAQEWLDRHPEVAASGAAKRIAEILAKFEGVQSDARVERQLPPLSTDEVLRHLDAPDHLPEMGNRLRAQPGVTYLHQVLRAIDGLAARQHLRTDPRWEAKLRTLTQHPDRRVRQAACLAYARVEGRRRGWLLEQARNPDEDLEVRRAALLGYSYGTDAQVYVDLMHFARMPEHELHLVALSRLADLDFGPAAAAAEASGDEGRPEPVRAAYAHLVERAEARAASSKVVARELDPILQRALVARVQGMPGAAAFEDATIELVVRQLRIKPGGPVNKVLVALQTAYADDAAFQRLVTMIRAAEERAE